MTNAEGYHKKPFSFDSAYLVGEQLCIGETGQVPRSGMVCMMFANLGGGGDVWLL